jgi:hypothetical protein
VVFDFATGTMDGVGFDAEPEALERYGRPANEKPHIDRRYALPQFGMEISVVKERVRAFTCVFSRAAAGTELHAFPGFEPCRLTIALPWGTRLPVGSKSTLAEPTDRLTLRLAEDPMEEMHAMTLDSVWMGCSFDDDGRLALIEFEPERARG